MSALYPHNSVNARSESDTNLKPRSTHRSLNSRRDDESSGYAIQTGRPSFLYTLTLLVLLGMRPERFRAQLQSSDLKIWDDFRDSLIKRWSTLGITSGLVLASATTMLFSDRVEGFALVAAFASLCGTIVSITFGTALAFIFTDAKAKDFKALAARPNHMVFLLSIPNMFAMGSMLALYVSITIFAWTFQNGAAVWATLARIGTTAGAVLMVLLFAYATWLLRGLEDEEGGRGVGARLVHRHTMSEVQLEELNADSVEYPNR